MSFGSSLKSLGRAQEAIVLGLMIVMIMAFVYFDFDLTLKIGIAVLVFAIIVLASVASQLLNMQKEVVKA